MLLDGTFLATGDCFWPLHFREDIQPHTHILRQCEVDMKPLEDKSHNPVVSITGRSLDYEQLPQQANHVSVEKVDLAYYKSQRLRLIM